MHLFPGKSHAVSAVKVAVLACAIALVCAGGATAASGKYVAIGDSYTSGMGINPIDSWVDGYVPSECLQSNLSYPYLVRQALGYDEFDDVSCAGATLAELDNAQSLDQGQSNPPQIDPLDSDTKLVTFSLGGNDVHFWDIMTTCFDNPATPCDYLGSGYADLTTDADDVGPRLAAALAEVGAAAPNAQLVVVGYPQIFPSDGAGCEDAMGASQQDAAKFDGFEQYLLNVIKTTAEGAGATYVDLYTPSIGHDACKPPGVRWIAPFHDYEPETFVAVHPNALGEASMALLVLDTLAGDPGDVGATGGIDPTGETGGTGASGASGASGDSGESGASDVSGVSGASDVSGVSGASDVSGVSGASGDSGASGASGDSGVSGASGDSGATGTTGASGDVGATGGLGPTGATAPVAGVAGPVALDSPNATRPVRLTGLRIRPRRFHRGDRHTTVRFNLSGDDEVRLTAIARRPHRTTATRRRPAIRLRVVTVPGDRGHNVLRIYRRFAHAKLASGLYELVVRPSGGSAHATYFRVLPAHPRHSQHGG